MGGERPILWGNLAGVASNLLWATTIPVTEMLLANWPPVIVAAGRLTTAALGILVLLGILRRPLRLREVPWWTVVRLAGLFMVPSVVLMVWGQDLADPMAAAIVVTTMPLVAAVIGWLSGTEKLSGSLFAALALAVVGGIVAQGGGSAAPPVFRGGELVVLAAIVLWVQFSRATVRDLAARDPLIQSLVTLAVSGTMLTLASAVLVRSGALPPVEPGWRDIGLFLWLGCIGIGGSLPLWFVSVRLLGVTVASLHQNLLPFYVMILTAVLGQGALGLPVFVGACLVSSGALIAQLPRLRRRPVAVGP